MNKIMRIIFPLIAIASLLAGGCAVSPGGSTTSGGSASGASTGGLPQNNVPGDILAQANALISDLSRQGYEVRRGYFRLYTEQDSDYSFQLMGSAYGNNPAAPYVTYAIPPWPEEYVDSADQYAFGLTAEGYNSIYRLDPREAIVVFGLMPPEAAYFGNQSYLFTREGTFDTNSEQYIFFTHYPEQLPYFFTTVPQNAARIQLFGSLSNSNNDAVILNQSGAVWNEERYFITTPDQFMNTAIREALGRISVAEKDIFTEPIPSLSVVGLDSHSDDFVNMIRYSEPNDGGGPGTPSNQWEQTCLLSCCA